MKRTTTAILLLALLATPACEALSSPAGQHATSALMSIVARAAERKLHERGYEVDRSGAICLNADEFGETEVPAVVCIIPGRLPE